MPSLYNLASSYQNVASLLDDETMEQEVICTALAEIKGNMVDKCANIAGLMKGLEADSNAIEAEIKRLVDRLKFTKNKRRWLTDYVREAMESTGQDKIKTPLISFVLQKNPPVVGVNMGMLPRKYIIETISQVPDKLKIKEAIKAGKVVPGAWISQAKSLRLK